MFGLPCQFCNFLHEFFIGYRDAKSNRITCKLHKPEGGVGRECSPAFAEKLVQFSIFHLHCLRNM